jgi:hypothetical protein
VAPDAGAAIVAAILIRSDESRQHVQGARLRMLGRRREARMNTELLRKKRLWNVADFAAWCGISHKQALSLLKQLNAETGGMLLRTSGGKKPEYTFFVAALAKVKPEIFERVDSLEARVDLLEEQMSERVVRERQIASQVGANSRDIVKLQRRPRAA